MITLLNAAPDTGNHGVSALCASAVDGLSRRGLEQIAVADHGRGCRRDSSGITRFGLSHTRRIWRGDCLRTVRAFVRMGGGPSASARVIARSRAVLDVSGGDSFTTLYGPKRFAAMTMTKQSALAAGRPLILLPQTLGPFQGEESRRIASSILLSASAVWVRDAQSAATLRKMLGYAFDPARHRKGPDMAVLLPAKKPTTLPRAITKWLTERSQPVAGLNVSGLLWQRPDAAQAAFGLAGSHQAQIEAAARAILAQTNGFRLVLVPHVNRPTGDPESDYAACIALSTRLSKDFPDRVAVLPDGYTVQELKWILSQLDWFAGARMHATVGAFSSSVPTLGFAYSDKAAGVFTECGIGDEIADLRQMDPDTLADSVVHSLRKREETQSHLMATLPKIKARAEAQMDAIAAHITSLSPQ